MAVIFFPKKREEVEQILHNLGIPYSIGDTQCHKEVPIITKENLEKLSDFMEIESAGCCENTKITGWKEKRLTFKDEWDPKLGFIGTLITGIAKIKTWFHVPENELEKIKRDSQKIELSLEALEITVKNGLIIKFFESGLYEVSIKKKAIPFTEIAKEQKANLAILIGKGNYHQAFKIITQLTKQGGRK